MKKAIKLLENRVKALKFMLDAEKKEDGNTFVLTSIDTDVRLNEAEYILTQLKEEYDKARSKSRTSKDSKVCNGKTS